jgi:NAD(P)-dependent dehydrogenase (short-subunit alcohol dehydrogenase family)
LVLSLAIDHAPEGIRCNAVCPTWVRTPLIAKEIGKHPEMMDLVRAVVPIQRMAESEELADTIAFLCSPAASYINGTSVIIDNGVTTTVRLH